jgi:hypothetical protein
LGDFRLNNKRKGFICFLRLYSRLDSRVGVVCHRDGVLGFFGSKVVVFRYFQVGSFQCLQWTGVVVDRRGQRNISEVSGVSDVSDVSDVSEVSAISQMWRVECVPFGQFLAKKNFFKNAVKKSCKGKFW